MLVNESEPKKYHIQDVGVFVLKSLKLIQLVKQSVLSEELKLETGEVPQALMVTFTGIEKSPGQVLT